jgi:type I restriction enzyme, S subunit
MTPDLLLAHFNRIADAPDAIPRLRMFVLDLAVRGKLVEQRDSDEPATQALEHIPPYNKSAMLTKKDSGIDKKRSSQNEQPFQLPTGWAWVSFHRLTRQADIGIDRGRSMQGPTLRYAYFKMNNIRNSGGFDVSEITRIDASKDEVERFTLSNGDFLFNTRNSRELVGKTCVFRVRSDGPILYNNNILRVRFHHDFAPDLFDFWFRSPQGKAEIEKLKSNTTNVCAIYQGKLASFPCPVPPLAEQGRIVAKVDELMSLCDRLEASQRERDARRDRLTAASHHHLNNHSDTDSLREHANFFVRYIPRLTARHDQINQLRQTILNLAVRGQLISQDSKDEPATELLARVAAEKKKAGNAKTGRDWTGHIMKPVNESFTLCQGWAWTRIANAVERVTVGYVGPMKDHYVEAGIPFLRSQNVRANRFRIEGLISISPQFHKTIAKSAIAPGDVVVVRSGNVGTACVIPPSLPVANCSDLVVVKRPLAILSDYLCFYLNSLAANHIEEGTVGVALTHFNTKSVATMPLPLPPFAEQHRIVAKVDELMAVCDRLEAQLISAQTDTSRLLEAVLHETLTASASVSSPEPIANIM